MEITVFNPSRVKSIAEKMIELIADLSLEDNPVIFHVFSNGGGAVYRWIMEILLQKVPPRLNVVGCIFDSSPGNTNTLFSLQAGACAVFRGVNVDRSWKRYILAILAFILMLFWQIMGYFAQVIGSEPAARVTYFNTLKNEPSRWPQLFLYSKADKLINHADVTEVAEHRKSLGVSVSTICWEDSEHVGHFSVHREAYTNAVYRFIDSCIPVEY